MPKLEKLHQKYSGRGLTVIGINEDGPRNRPKVKPFLRRLKITYPILIDGDGALLKRFLAPGCPTALLISSDGEEVLRQVGYFPGHDQALVEAIEGLLPLSSDP